MALLIVIKLEREIWKQKSCGRKIAEPESATSAVTRCILRTTEFSAP
jgi:hypothetical protein